MVEKQTANKGDYFSVAMTIANFGKNHPVNLLATMLLWLTLQRTKMMKKCTKCLKLEFTSMMMNPEIIR